MFLGLLRNLVKEMETEPNTLLLLVMEHVKSTEVRVKDNVSTRM
jgi:hypothetical protein